MKRIIPIVALLLTVLPLSAAKKKTAVTDSEGRPVKTGWNFGILPSVAYDADLGFQGGLLSNVFYYGDGSTYPDYLHSLYFEAAYTTRRYGIFRFQYDSPVLIRNHRFTLDLSYLPDSMCDFFGFNGYQSVYNTAWRDSKAADLSGYASRAFYKYRRNLFRASADISGTVSGAWQWSAGLGVLGYMIGDVDVAMLNRHKKASKQLPDIQGLFSRYRDWGLIRDNESSGGWHPYVRGGMSYDSRDRRTAPSRGIYADAFFTYTAAFGEQAEYNNLRFNFTFRHYVPLYRDRIVLAYRIGTQNLVAGKSPFYQNSFLNVQYYKRVLYEGLGGSSSLRGVLRNRINADGYLYANLEFRFRIVDFSIGRQHFYFGMNPFVDFGMVTQAFDFDRAVAGGTENLKTLVSSTLSPSAERKVALGELVLPEGQPIPDEYRADPADFFDFSVSPYRPHLSGGCGLKLAMNENFVVSVDWAAPFSRQDNHSLANFYIKMGYLF